MAEFQLIFDTYILPWLLIEEEEEEAFQTIDEIYASPQCLVAGTPVETSEGLKAIETIRAGDLVWAWNNENECRELKRVTRTFVSHRSDLIEVVLDGALVLATSEHPFFTQDRVWKQAGQLSPGDLLFEEGNPEGRVIHSVTRIRQPCAVYNMEVEGLHNYFVTSAGILLHNGWQYNHFFQNAFAQATGKHGIRNGKEALGNARRMSKVAHLGFHRQFNAYLERINMRPVRGKSASDIVAQQNLNFENVVRKFKPFFNNKPKWKPLFDAEVRALRANRRTLR